MEETWKRAKELLDSEVNDAQLRRRRYSRRATYFLVLFTLSVVGAIWWQQFDLIFVSTIFLGISAILALMASDANGLSHEIAGRSWSTPIPRFPKRPVSSSETDGNSVPSGKLQPTPGGLGAARSMHEDELAGV